MKRLTTVLVIAYALMLCGVGIVGIFTAPWELTRVFGLDLSPLTPQARATFLNQYGFLKALELGGGLFCLFLHNAILNGGLIGRLFLALVGSGVVARSFAWIVHGQPTWPFIAFLLLEALVFLSTLLYLRSRRAI